MTELLIGQDWELAEGPTSHELFDPTTRRLLATMQCASPAQRQRAVDAARGAVEGWAGRPADERLAAIGVIVEEIRQAAGALAERQVIETGQPSRECQDLVANAVRRLRNPSEHDGEPAEAQVGHSAQVRQSTQARQSARVRQLPRQALWPFWEDILKAIAAGSTVVCELPVDRALTALAIARCAQRLPPGVLNVITVAMETPASTLTDAATEFVFVGQDANLDVAVAGAAALRLYNTGQRVGRSARIHVEAPLAYRFADRLHAYLAFLEAGDPRKPATDLGPLQSEAALQRAIEQIGNALKQGALVKLGGREYQPWGLRGYFLQPTVLVEGSGVERAPYESILGPVVIISPTTDIGAALRESVGMTHRGLRLTAFTGQVQKLERSLRAASFEPRSGAYTLQVDRAWKTDFAGGAITNAVDIELIEEPQVDWFPYNSRRGMKL